MANGQTSWKSAGFFEGIYVRARLPDELDLVSVLTVCWMCAGTRFRLLLPDLRLNTDVPYRALQAARIRALCLTYLQRTWDPCQVPERLRLRVDNTHGLAGLCRFRDYITGQLWSGFEASATMTTFVMEVAGATRTLGEWLMEGTVSWLRGMSYWW
uniref:Uncharacterized protein n=1 Tax=Setaria italica TaxID=4555 RepID=K4AG68_SETIT